MKIFPPSPSARLDVLIVGAGPRGLGYAVALKAWFAAFSLLIAWIGEWILHSH